MSQQMVCYSQPSGGINLGILLGEKKGRHLKKNILRNKKKKYFGKILDLIVC